MDSAAVDGFEAGRGRLASLAYRLLGSAAEAEDAVQDTFLRWLAADRERIDVPEAWLTRVLTRICLDRLRSARARHERSAGAWLPEPLLDGDPMLGPADTFEQRESVSLAVLTLMERLSPNERAVYVLREAFAYSHAEIAAILDITEAASQQNAHRARARVAGERRRGGAPDPVSARRVVEEFLTAAASGRTERLVALLTEDVTAVSDGAGSARRLLRHRTPERVASFVRAGFRPTAAKRRLTGGPAAMHVARVNGSPAVIAVVGGRVVGAVAFDVDGDGRVAALYGVGAAHRLARLDAVWRRHEPGVPVIGAW
ncbi:sigma-70 family RNA polymerase sigma factor [Streptomyces californicus]|uniref:sigma-70 family RNA polymerase sigma factor n=1 Tax=Streptomyces californicus TaxID=67351 RepID=UPI00296F078B|nr:sigma-70 family RNA polymerase sigma factor [Streptomyces californicus]MDW4915874.1 sigma-70 family RNA polymerase sigma factor [Streptomyces californicus]